MSVHVLPRLFFFIVLGHCPACMVLQDSLEHAWDDRYPPQELSIETVEPSGYSGTSIVTVRVRSKEDNSDTRTHRLLCPPLNKRKTRFHSWTEWDHCRGPMDPVIFNVHHEFEIFEEGHWRKIGRVPALKVRSRKLSSFAGIWIHGLLGLLDLGLLPAEILYFIGKKSIPCEAPCPAALSKEKSREPCHFTEEEE